MFHPSDNAVLDAPTGGGLEFIATHLHRAKEKTINSSFIDSYLAFRVPLRSRPDPRRPFAALDIAISARLTPDFALSAAQLLDVVVLFPPDIATPFIGRLSKDLVVLLRQLRNAVDSGEETVEDAVDVILNLVRAGGADVVLTALSGNCDPSDDLRACLNRWMSPAKGLATSGESEFLRNASAEILATTASSDSGIRNTSAVSDIESALLEVAPSATLEDVRAALSQTGHNAEAAVNLLLGGQAENVPAALKAIGKRTERRRHVHDVRNNATFSGAEAEEDGGYSWLKKRIDAELARLETVDPDDPRESKRQGAYSFLLDGGMNEAALQMYDDDPDDALLEGEEAIEPGTNMPQSSGVGDGMRVSSGKFRGLDSETTVVDGASDGYSSPDEGAFERFVGSRQTGAAPLSGQEVGNRSAAGERPSESEKIAQREDGGPNRGRGRGGRGRGRGGGSSQRGGARGGSGAPRGGRGRGSRGGRGGRGGANHGRREGAAKKQARAGI